MATLIAVICGGLLIFLPTVLANKRRHHHRGLITLLNILAIVSLLFVGTWDGFLAVALFGWISLLVWSCFPGKWDWSTGSLEMNRRATSVVKVTSEDFEVVRK
jgi:uncharacterized membrane protein (GlpM family)